MARVGIGKVMPPWGVALENGTRVRCADLLGGPADAEKELKKIPFFVRGKARRNTETFAVERGVAEISVDTLYEAKAHYAR